ncbi:MAG: hypothetical protein C4320_09310, partial [Armatimonadota bacterium]
MRSFLAIPLVSLAATGVIVACSAAGGRQEGAKMTDQAAIANLDYATRQQPPGLGGGTRGANVPAFWIRTGYRVERVTTLPNARFLEFDDRGRLLVSRPDKGEIALLARQADGTYGAAKTLVTNMPSVHG